MMQRVVFPDVVAITLELIHDELGVATGTRVPNPRPTTFILARRLGGERVNPVQENVRILFECWAGTPAEADDLAANVRAYLFARATPGAWAGNALGTVGIYRVDDLTGQSDEPDQLSDQPVATFTLQFLARGSITEENP